MTIDTAFLDRCIHTLDTAFARLDEQTPPAEGGGISREIVRAACVKEFELVLEQCGSLLRKRLRPYFASNQQPDRLTFKDLFRHAAKHGLISVEDCERWLAYREHRNETAHQYGADFAEATLALLPAFIADARALARTIAEAPDD
ncbi:MAG: nucleotidyltransferase substrate binding protein [Chloroflexi bacterium]|nr:nucleotidyltransferase substrate binding protein [Chloroflexota bacterium]